jgi:hypothetical protein
MTIVVNLFSLTSEAGDGDAAVPPGAGRFVAVRADPALVVSPGTTGPVPGVVLVCPGPAGAVAAGPLGAVAGEAGEDEAVRGGAAVEPAAGASAGVISGGITKAATAMAATRPSMPSQ